MIYAVQNKSKADLAQFKGKGKATKNNKKKRTIISSDTSRADIFSKHECTSDKIRICRKIKIAG